MIKAAIYCRVSTALQEQEKTIESQKAELEEICRKQGVQIVKEYIDNGWSGETLDRPDLDQLRTDASKGIFERVYFHSNDRLSRDLTNQGIVVEDLENKGIEIFFHDKIITDTPEGKFLFEILGAAAEFEKAKILERTKRGKLYKAKQGIPVGGISPYGYNYIKKTKEKKSYYRINEAEAKIVNLIVDLYLQLGSVRAVAKELTKRNIKPRKGLQWRTSTLHRILRGESYIGTTYYNKSYGVEINNGKKYRKRIKNGRKLRKKEEWISITVPPIITKEKFYAVQSLLVSNHRSFDNRKHSYLLGGLIKCGNCGSTYSGELNHGHSYYRCNNRHATFPLPKKCNGRMVATSKLDTVVWDTISEAIKNPKILISYIFHTVEEIQKNESKETLAKQKQDLIANIEGLKSKKSRILELYADGTITDKSQTAEQIETYNKQMEELGHQIKDIDTKLDQNIDRPLQRQDIEYFCQLAATRLESLSLEERHFILTRLIEKIIFYSLEGRAKIIGRIPLPEGKKVTLDEILNDQYGTMSTSSKRYVRQKRQLSMPFSLFPDF